LARFQPPSGAKCSKINGFPYLVFQGFTKQNDGIPAVFASFGRFGPETTLKTI
jgi:hypothetical protein